MGILLQGNRLGGKRFYRVVLFLPNVTATVAVGLVFTMLFDFNSGLVNGFLQALGVHRLPWLNSTGLSKIPVMVLNVWRVTPWYMLIILSGLQGINPELYQAATVDGAGAAQAGPCHHPEPRHGPVLLLPHGDHRFVPDLHRAVHHDGGGPGSSSLSIVQYLYESGFTVFKLGYSSAIGYVLTLMLLVISAVQVFFLRRSGSVVGGRAPA